jgi:hypothetical protein
VNELTGAATLVILLEVAPGDEEDFEDETEDALHDFALKCGGIRSPWDKAEWD